jgi:hypothetical protein
MAAVIATVVRVIVKSGTEDHFSTIRRYLDVRLL